MKIKVSDYICNFLLKNDINSSLALPFSGGALIFIFIESLKIPITSFLLELGIIFKLTIIPCLSKNKKSFQ